MGLIGHWRRSVLGAGGVALLLPLGLTLGVALTTALGGGTTLRALGQVIAGPAQVTGPAGEGLESAGSLPAVPVRTRVSRASGPAGGGTATTPVPVVDAAPGPTAGPEGPGPSGPSGPGPAEPASPTAPSSPPTGPGPAPAPNSAVSDAADETAGATDLLPAPAGDAAGNAVDTVVDLIP